jgi:hypothetical protein
MKTKRTPKLEMVAVRLTPRARFKLRDLARDTRLSQQELVEKMVIRAVAADFPLDCGPTKAQP